MAKRISLFSKSASRGSMTLFDHSISTSGGSGEHSTVGSGGGWPPLATTVDEWSVSAPQGIDSGGTYFYRGRVSTAGTPIMPIASLVYPSTYTNVSVGYTVPALDPTSDTAINNTVNYGTDWVSGITTPSPMIHGIVYEIPGAPTMSWTAGGLSFGTVTISGTSRYCPLTDSVTSTDQGSSQQPWPASGIIRYFAVVWSNLNSGDVVQIALQHHTPLHANDFGTAVDTPFVYNLTGVGGSTRQAIRDMTTTFTVYAGDLLNIRIVRLSGTDTSITVAWFFGFEPS